MGWVYSTPTFLLGFLMMLVFVLVGLAGMAFTRKFIRPRLVVSAHDNEFVGVILHGMLVMYGLALGLIAINAWDNYANDSRLVSNEAAAIAMLHRDFSAYPDSTRNVLQLGLRDYTEHIIQQSWPVQRQGRVPDGGGAFVDRVEKNLYSFVPHSDAEIVYHSQALDAYNHMIEARRLRLDAVKSGLPAVMWAIVLLGAAICLAGSFLFRVDSPGLHYAMVGLLASLTGLVIFMILIFDSPFRGTHGVGPDAYELILHQLMKP